jgi:hypothetical protein
MIRAKKMTTVRRKMVGVPITNAEKYEKLKIINPEIEKLKEVFGLEIEL